MVESHDHYRMFARLQEIPAAGTFVLEAARRAGLSGKALNNCQLAVDEVCTNIVEHGYGGDQADQVIDIYCSRNATTFTVEIRDDAPPFNPLKQISPDPETPLGQRRAGGWGVYFVNKLMDDVTYRYVDGRNHLSMMKRISSESVTEAAQQRDGKRGTNGDTSDGLKIVLLNGCIDKAASSELEQIFGHYLKAKYRCLILDMTDVEYVSSSGLKLLVKVWKQMRDANGDLVLASVPSPVLEVFRLIGFDLVFTIFDSPADAVAKFR